ncbi:MAG: DUF1015 domain-containing protein [Sphaerochaetaceae bacterium]|nr:DUF1015 domain-containing protein [Sphaerochaetaceae bacterium]
MKSIKERLNEMGLFLPNILIPKKEIDLKKWAVVACDQYTSEKEYWKRVDKFVGECPSTLRLIYPECYLGEKESKKRIDNINKTMASYSKNNIFDEYQDSFFLVKRDVENKTRWGLIVCLDLERYSWEKDSKSLIRATEGTILSRIPPRKEIRKDALLEIPHIMVLINDKEQTVIEPFKNHTQKLNQVYNTKLMEKGGSITSWQINEKQDLEKITKAFETLYSNLDESNPLLFAMGDGNHSFATAKSCWLDIRENLTEEEIKNHPARFCLVELENIYDSGLVFEPIHRVLFNIKWEEFFNNLMNFCSGFEKVNISNIEVMMDKIENNKDPRQCFGICYNENYYIVFLEEPKASLVAGTLQYLIDSLINEKTTVDYTHGIEITQKKGNEKNNIGLFLPGISKDTFFDSIIKDGALPRKTFSMGNANEKRFYMETRRIK